MEKISTSEAPCADTGRLVPESPTPWRRYKNSKPISGVPDTSGTVKLSRAPQQGHFTNFSGVRILTNQHNTPYLKQLWCVLAGPHMVCVVCLGPLVYRESRHDCSSCLGVSVSVCAMPFLCNSITVAWAASSAAHLPADALVSMHLPSLPYKKHPESALLCLPLKPVVDLRTTACQMTHFPMDKKLLTAASLTFAPVSTESPSLLFSLRKVARRTQLPITENSKRNVEQAGAQIKKRDARWQPSAHATRRAPAARTRSAS